MGCVPLRCECGRVYTLFFLARMFPKRKGWSAVDRTICKQTNFSNSLVMETKRNERNKNCLPSAKRGKKGEFRGMCLLPAEEKKRGRKKKAKSPKNNVRVFGCPGVYMFGCL